MTLFRVLEGKLTEAKYDLDIKELYYYETIMIFETETREVLVNAVPPREHSSNKTGNESLEANGIVVVQRRRM